MKRKLLIALVCALLLVTMAIAPVAQAATVELLTVNVDGARLRVGPGDYPVITSLRKGTKVLYAGQKTNAFCLVRTASGEQGYVYQKFLSAYGAVQSRQLYKTARVTPLYKNVNNKPVLAGYAPSGVSVVVFEVRGGWAYVRSMSGKGAYVQTKYLTK